MDIDKLIADIIEKANKLSDPADIYFHWDSENKTWCLSGLTVGGNYFETDYVLAESREDAENQAVDYLMSYKDAKEKEDELG
jgi:hypothetical protein